MKKLIESIQLLDGKLLNLFFHNQRFNHAREILFPHAPYQSLEDLIVIPQNVNQGVYKCRIVYQAQIQAISFQPYQARTVQSLKLIVHDQIDYSHKYEDRREIQDLFQQKGPANDILIVKQGQISDSSYANIIFFDGQKWLTPAYPLLAGTQRAKLLQDQKIIPEIIRPSDLKHFKYARLINAMLPMEQAPQILIQNIYP